MRQIDLLKLGENVLKKENILILLIYMKKLL